MHTKEYNGLEINYPGPDLYEDEIRSAMDLLNQLIEDIESYPDKSLFFQNPQIYDGWLQLVGSICKLEKWSNPEDDSKWEERSETYVEYLLTLRGYTLSYQSLYLAYFGKLKSILEIYGGWLKGLCFSDEAIEMLSVEKELLDREDIELSLAVLNSNSLKSRTSVYDTLSKLFDFLSALMDRGLLILMDLKPSVDDFAKAIDDDLREWTRSFGKDMFREMKEELNRHFKESRTAPYTPELWGLLLDADEDALNKAKRQELASCDDAKQEHWGEDRKTEMDENGKLMHLIYTSCHTDELFELGKAENVEPFIEFLTPDNLPMFYDIIVRRNLIQCEMFPELKKQHDEWLNGFVKQSKESVESGSKDTSQLREENKLNYVAPKLALQDLLKGVWFDSVSVDKEKYSVVWRQTLVEELMKSDYGKNLAEDWADESKRPQVKFAFIGALKDFGVFNCSSYSSLASKFNVPGIDSASLAKYMGYGKRKKYYEWLKQQVKPEILE